MKKNKPKIRKYNKKLKKIDDEETIIQLEEKLLKEKRTSPSIMKNGEKKQTRRL